MQAPGLPTNIIRIVRVSRDIARELIAGYGGKSTEVDWGEGVVCGVWLWCGRSSLPRY
ncbi:MAG: hypothetical protein F6K19_35815 [Cyanothece sp. SIO1E1]|nr:hypothetical protein [Cyanothece sp. SIO1E1]